MTSRIAIVTGAASGIGRAIATALVARGDTVVVADLNKDGAEKVAERLAGRGQAVPEPVDVTDSSAVEELCRSVKERYGRLDLMFNNAGIAVGGLAEEFALDHWDKTIDVNLRGVVHGVHAAYPIMLGQGSGHIVNTASLAGLVPAPLVLPYTTTKYAVVGLSMALRAEAAGRGVRVSVICPSFVDTPLLDHANPGLPKTSVGENPREEIRKAWLRLYSPEALARDVLRGVDRNHALIVAPASGRAAWRAARLSPSLAGQVARLAVERVRRGLG